MVVVNIENLLVFVVIFCTFSVVIGKVNETSTYCCSYYNLFIIFIIKIAICHRNIYQIFRPHFQLIEIFTFFEMK